MAYDPRCVTVIDLTATDSDSEGSGDSDNDVVVNGNPVEQYQ